MFIVKRRLWAEPKWERVPGLTFTTYVEAEQWRQERLRVSHSEMRYKIVRL